MLPIGLSYKSPLDFTPKFGFSFGEGIGVVLTAHASQKNMRQLVSIIDIKQAHREADLCEIACFTGGILNKSSLLT